MYGSTIKKRKTTENRDPIYLNWRIDFTIRQNLCLDVAANQNIRVHFECKSLFTRTKLYFKIFIYSSLYKYLLIQKILRIIISIVKSNDPAVSVRITLKIYNFSLFLFNYTEQAIYRKNSLLSVNSIFDTGSDRI
jgi:hypothetical protein